MRSTCDVSTGYGLAIFPICQSAEFKQNGRGYDVRESVRNDDDWVSLRCPNGKDELDIVQAS